MQMDCSKHLAAARQVFDVAVAAIFTAGNRACGLGRRLVPCLALGDVAQHCTFRLGQASYRRTQAPSEQAGASTGEQQSSCIFCIE